MKIARYDDIPWSVSPGTRGGGNLTTDTMKKGDEGFKYKRLFTGAPGALGNFEMVVLRTEQSDDPKHYPRHNHAFEQVRLTLVGKPDWTPKSVTPEGWVIYMGAGTHYGPYSRHAEHEQLHLQFQGAGCPPFVDYNEMAAARDALAKKGSFERGVYTWYDEKGQRHNKDGHAATVEYATSQPLVVPVARYDNPVNMNPEAYDWIEVGPGAWRKELGSFTEAETRVSFLKLAAGAAYTMPRAEQRNLIFVRYGKGAANGQTISERDGLNLDPGESGIKLTSSTDLEFFILGLPKLECLGSAQATPKPEGKKSAA